MYTAFREYTTRFEEALNSADVGEKSQQVVKYFNRKGVCEGGMIFAVA